MNQRVRKVQLLKHPNGRSPNWYLRWWEWRPDKGKWQERWQSTKTTVKRDAEKKRRQLERELDDGKRPDANMAWEDFVAEFLDKHAVRKAVGTIIAYKMCLQAVSNTAKPRRLGDITVAMLEDYANARIKEGIAPATVNKELRHLRAALRWAAKREYLNRVPDFSPVFIRVDERQPVTIPEADFLAMVQALKDPHLPLERCPADWWKTFLYLAYYLGLRRGELLGLTWGNVDLDGKEITVRAHTSKGRKDRVLPLHDVLVELLRARKQQTGVHVDHDRVLPWPFDTYRHLYDDWHVIQKAAGLAEGEHYVPKNCRSSCASQLIAAGIPTSVVKDYLGHASVTTTERYYINTKPAMRATATAREVKDV